MWPPIQPAAPPPQPRIEGWSTEELNRPSRPPRRRPRRRHLAAALAVLLVVVSAVVLATRRTGAVPADQGESGKDAQQILDDSAFAFYKTSSVHLTGSVATGDETDVYDLYMSPVGPQGTIVAGGATLSVVVLGDDAYLRGHDFFEAFAGHDAASIIGDKWVHVKTDDPKLGQYLLMVSMPGLQHIISQLAVDNALSKGAVSTVDGVRVIALTAEGGEVDIAVTGKPYPRALRASIETLHMDLRFSGYDTPQPPPQKPVDVLGQSERLSL